jgi:glycosyltransferase involved in cell wall biosynthesis
VQTFAPHTNGLRHKSNGEVMTTNKLRILYVAYPLLPVSDESAGGAEQMLNVLEREMHSRGHSTIVAACEGSKVAGELFVTGEVPSESDRFDQREAEHSAQVIDFIEMRQQRGSAFDLVHDKSGHFFKHAAEVPGPVLATLHLPRSFYARELFANCAPNLLFNCVSQSQANAFADVPQMTGVIENGIEVPRFPYSMHKRDYLLWMGRICEEKGTHIAIDAAEQAGLPLIIAGQVYPFSYHQEYFIREVASRLDRARVQVQFVQKPSFTEKLHLLQNARALLIPALADETSSLVAMEAMACGTPVIAFRRGALPEVIADEKTGFVVNSLDELVQATRRAHEISPQACRTRIEDLYDSRRMTGDYEALYRRVLNGIALRKAERRTA